jgi:hypothetical protein
MHSLGAGSAVPLFSGRHLLDALSVGLAVLWLPVVRGPGAAAGLLRAAAHRRAAVGLSLGSEGLEPLEWRRQVRPGALFQAVVRAAAELPWTPPFCLHVESPAAPGVDSPEAEALEAGLATCLGAGFTSLGLDLSACPPVEGPVLAERLLGQAMQFELGWSVRLPVPGGGPAARVDGVLSGYEALRARGLPPDLLLLPGPDELGEAAWALAAVVAPEVRPCGLAWRSIGRARVSPGQAGVRALLGDERLGGPREGQEPGRDEAMAYVDALDALDALGARGSAERVIEFLGQLSEPPPASLAP